MNRSELCLTTFAITAGACFAVACGSSSNGTSDFGGATPAATATTDGADGVSATAPSGDFGSGTADPPAEAPPKIIFYANTDTTLYQLDPDDLTKPMAKVGDFDCVGPGADTSVMTDIAVDKHGNIFGVSPAAAWPLTAKGDGTVHCETKWPLAYGTHFNGLTFAPENTVDVDEVLIGGNSNGELYRIDAGTGESTLIGTLGTDPSTGEAWTVSGDIVFLANAGNPVGYATARTCTNTPSGCVSTDTLLEIDVKALKPGAQDVAKAVRGAVDKGSWCTNSKSPSSFGSMFGVTALKDKVYGFSRRGDFVEITNDTGSGCLVWSDSTMKFAGAGVTTIAPASAPPPR